MRTSARRHRCVVALAVAAAAALPSAAGAAPGSIVVPCDGEGGGVAGLRAAIAQLNSSGGGTIELERGCTYVVPGVDNRTRSGANGLPVVRSSITITLEQTTPLVGIGVGPEQDDPVSIERRGGPAFRLFEVARGGRLTVRHVALVGGAAPTGGTIRNNGESLSLSYVSISGSTASGPIAHGGAIWSASRVGLLYSSVTRATAVGRSAEGGAVWSGGGVSMSYSTVARSVARAREGDAAGGGVYSRGPVELRYSDVHDNTASSASRRALGGGVFAPTGVSLSYSGIAGNVAAGRPAEGGGIYSPRAGIETSYSTVEGNRPDNCRC